MSVCVSVVLCLHKHECIGLDIHVYLVNDWFFFCFCAEWDRNGAEKDAFNERRWDLFFLFAEAATAEYYCLEITFFLLFQDFWSLAIGRLIQSFGIRYNCGNHSSKRCCLHNLSFIRHYHQCRRCRLHRRWRRCHCFFILYWLPNSVFFLFV